MGSFTLDMNAALFPQVGKMGKDYWQWVHRPSSQRTFRMFKHDFFETFAATAWWVIPLVWLPVITYLCSSSLGLYTLTSRSYEPLAPASLASSFAAGVLAWTLLEYILHRFLFHILFSDTSNFFITFHFLLHGQHHKFPLDQGRLVFPPVAGFMMATPFYIMAHSSLPFAQAEAGIAGAIAGYVAYDLIHYYLHHGQPSWQYFKDLKNYHREHHYRNPDRGFGISSKLWDVVFRTLLRKS
eukprot:TRINITY_DN260_c0_g1_i2.p1 TRINITY_DN260_c0_g1~~TRINITY_DN260_c0_g1_i2.p1  ORF type:complete len:240 (+),score=22.40 TRINITY_DN260_c0_g1_i2:57-776(+)